MSSDYLSQHLQNLKQSAERFHSQWPMQDKFPPQLKPEDGTLVGCFISRWISYYYTTKVFIKRQAHADELGVDIYGNPCIRPYIANRLRNKAAALQYLTKHTNIPVPNFLNL